MARPLPGWTLRPRRRIPRLGASQPRHHLGTDGLGRLVATDREVGDRLELTDDPSLGPLEEHASHRGTLLLKRCAPLSWYGIRLLDLDDPVELVARGLRPAHLLSRNRNPDAGDRRSGPWQGSLGQAAPVVLLRAPRTIVALWSGRWRERLDLDPTRGHRRRRHSRPTDPMPLRPGFTTGRRVLGSPDVRTTRRDASGGRPTVSRCRCRRRFTSARCGAPTPRHRATPTRNRS